MDTQIAYGLLSLLQDRAAGVFNPENADTRLFVGLTVADSLLKQLKDPAKKSPDDLTLDLSGLLDQVDVFGVATDGDASGLLDRLKGKVDALGKSLLEGRGLADARTVIENLVTKAAPAGAGSAPIKAILKRQLGIGLSFATTLRNLASPELARDIPAGWKAYFFGERGFETIDGITIVPPAHGGELLAGLAPSEPNLAAIEASVRKLGGALKERSGEQYVRDLIRITAEVAGDRRYQLRDRYGKMLTVAGDRDKAARWFKGAASMAESLVTGAVEEACLGVAQFQTNPILAAAAATFAGTVARKATQHVFLAEVER